MAYSAEIKALIEATLIDSDTEKASDIAYRLAAEGATEDGPDKPFYQEAVLAYRTKGGTRPDETVPEEVSGLVFIEHPEETFDASRYFVTDQARKIANQVHSMRVSATKLRALGLPSRNTTLMYGEPGTGKTELARWIAFNEGLPLMYVNMSSTVDSLMGRTARNISKIFSFAHTGACVLMIDELDCVANTRASAVRAADGELNRTTITFMQEIDRLPPNVILLAATNREDMLDPALRRRFAQVEFVERLPEHATRSMLDDWSASIERKCTGIHFTPEELDGLMEGYADDESITQAIVVQRGTTLLAEKLANAAEDIKPRSTRAHVRAFRVIDPVDGVDVTRDMGRQREYAQREDWARRLYYSGDPDGFLLDADGHLQLWASTTHVLAPTDRFEIVLSKFAEGEE